MIDRGVDEALKSAFPDYLRGFREQRLIAVGEGRGGTMLSAEVSKAVASSDLVPQYRIQRHLRPLYGKTGLQPPDIGDHPDFAHLKGTGTVERCPITTLFMDIESSTRLSLLYDLEDVYYIKNAFICAAIEIVKAFDGHVHRIMGDAVMAYFGGKKSKPETGVIDALNCASMLLYFVKRSVIPQLNQQVASTDFGIRVGVDFGKREDVLWSAYGFPGMEEVTATSFYVDVASKLQHAAPRNQMMIGDSLRGFLDLPAELLDVKRVQRDGRDVTEPCVTPNHVGKDGRCINYGQHVLKWDKYLTLSPLAPLAKDIGEGQGSNPAGVVVTATVHRGENGPQEAVYVSSGSISPKDRNLRFKVRAPLDLRTPAVVKFRVENHGDEARQLGGANMGNHESNDYPVNSKLDFLPLEHWESTKYRGLHYMIVEISSGGVLTHRTKFGVYVE